MQPELTCTCPGRPLGRLRLLAALRDSDSTGCARGGVGAGLTSQSVSRPQPQTLKDENQKTELDPKIF